MAMKEDYKNELSKILNSLGKELDISKSQYEAAVKSYESVGDWLSKEESPLYKYSPKILPQGSFMLGTMIKPVNVDDDIDIDLVCKLEGKPINWTQKHLKNVVGDRLKSYSTSAGMIKDVEESRRCWVLEYSDDANYHMDILPSVADNNLMIFLNESFSNIQDLDADKLAIRITDKEANNYSYDINAAEWMKSNPFGYAKWFFQRAIFRSTKLFSLNESIDPVRSYDNEKMPLQRVVQLLKRHRDIMFLEEQYDIEDKPISVIITTLAAKAYDKNENIVDAYSNIVSKMRGLIEVRLDPKTGRYENWVGNPVNEEENFADKWGKNPQKKQYFYNWLDRLEKDLYNLKNSQNIGLQRLNESFSIQYGKELTNKVFSDYGKMGRMETEKGLKKMAGLTGMLGNVGIKVPNHNFEGLNGK